MSPVASPVVHTRPSPVFLGIVAAWLFGAWACWTQPFDAKYAVFLFVFFGWIVSLCLHEYGHARTAFWAGDTSVTERGYLTLNPLKYVHPGLSLLMPLVFLVMGGIGLPGGAVWVNTGAIPERWKRSAMSFAGPATNLVLGVLTALPFHFARGTLDAHRAFAYGLAFLSLLQFLTGVFNLLPVPGLDGFGVIEPYVPRTTLEAIAPYRGYAPVVLFFLIFQSPAFNNQVFGRAYRFASFFGVDRLYASFGFSLFQFWRH